MSKTNPEDVEHLHFVLDDGSEMDVPLTRVDAPTTPEEAAYYERLVEEIHSSDEYAALIKNFFASKAQRSDTTP